MVTHVFSPIEFYACHVRRLQERDELRAQLQQCYHHQNMSLSSYLEDTPCVIQHRNRFERAIIKHREDETKVAVKCIDGGEEVIVDTSELLAIQSHHCEVPRFAQPFRLYDYDESIRWPICRATGEKIQKTSHRRRLRRTNLFKCFAVVDELKF
ncbi:unnamed protein product [Didymodactylos carnosus]|uniref:Tudor domain-containing protein n=1 Tax=Didymodactylos carnosus TaxID=1234261 RepID=A0A814WWR3_9BILA|nr:unnamed protein product [Didymodactylos carnosus]CAF1203783.1 unnamed protein product [Didymodactylos carnosus]CAF3550199.1 unnamed protein product [Didymodactylos carnosus]CAF3968122.1 unnamed protein product [Didymodactylos carnosus]